MAQAATWGCPLAADAPVAPSVMATRIDDSLDALLSSHAGATRPTYAVAGMVWRDTDTGLLFMYDGTNDLQITVLNNAAPISASDTGTAGQWAQDGDYIYVCTATDTWKRVAIATWV